MNSKYLQLCNLHFKHKDDENRPRGDAEKPFTFTRDVVVLFYVENDEG